MGHEHNHSSHSHHHAIDWQPSVHYHETYSSHYETYSSDHEASNCSHVQEGTKTSGCRLIGWLKGEQQPLSTMGHKHNHSSHSQHHAIDWHPSLDYHMTYSSHHEASNCKHVKEAAKHHRVDWKALIKLLVNGINLASAIASLVMLV